uniref:Uncharacterized protein n=1 Tax=Chromera velia CCMP2878 TaxID=1169474 RepID=A0A0G4IDL8_9ALVE|mmetsp:Transcript_39911/g.78709  ORF Transcript_39911/g.78709 Transcript_39911/m.78709 type:complete len:90 (-) Transcript_39911:85-354(-)|eukprot:Cvel_13416.t1-p1 / transcript=Cvel_13416.t1 / gene=Cvel_13416 / organism=Chromera_velia_CCMP2878 / gene_product=hypothetical protein / transcript_product=hypothetical protein / location=Cvel_scaffold915:903-1876(-) / protein_length=89 / sequence_SO=supercontig / SO=protein_coding / is_pseudo=false
MEFCGLGMGFRDGAIALVNIAVASGTKEGRKEGRKLSSGRECLRWVPLVTTTRPMHFWAHRHTHTPRSQGQKADSDSGGANEEGGGSWG